jgi:3-phenylpropionate/trans-cinnamate dioxygenase ferredoxin reductase component
MTETAIIVGAGQAGGHAAIALRDAGHAGPILLIGDEAERPHERPPLSKDMLTAAEEPPLSYFHTEDRYAEKDIQLLCGTAVTAIDPAGHRVQLADGRELSYGKLLLATGGSARRLDVPGADRVLYLRTIEDARRIRPRLVPGAQVVCIGAGVIGLEIAASARARGCTVTVIEAGPTPMGRSLTPDMAGWLAELHRQAGVTLRFNLGVAAIEPGLVRCTDGSLVPADTVIAGIGMARNLDLAAAAGLDLDGGIAVDEFGRTSVPDIYAAGDVAAFWVPRLQRRMRLESWRHAQNHGIAVGRSMAGVLESYDEVPWFWTDQHGTNLQMAGTVEGVAHAVTRGDRQATSFSVWYLDGKGSLIGVVGVNAPRDVRAAQGLIRAGRPIDAAAVADPAVPLQRLAKAVA